MDTPYCPIAWPTNWYWRLDVMYVRPASDGAVLVLVVSSSCHGLSFSGRPQDKWAIFPQECVPGLNILPERPSSVQHDTEATDLSTILVRPFSRPHQSAIYSQALDLLDSLQTSPSCIRLATSTLLTSCQTFDDQHTSSTEPTLDDTRSLYAARLALCEISGAGLNIPAECELLHLANDSDVKQQHHQRMGGGQSNSPHRFGTRQIRECLQSLESRPQWWTSYSNSRQNAAIMCQAARADIEKGKCHVLFPIKKENWLTLYAYRRAHQAA